MSTIYRSFRGTLYNTISIQIVYENDDAGSLQKKDAIITFNDQPVQLSDLTDEARKVVTNEIDMFTEADGLQETSAKIPKPTFKDPTKFPEINPDEKYRIAAVADRKTIDHILKQDDYTFTLEEKTKIHSPS